MSTDRTIEQRITELLDTPFQFREYLRYEYKDGDAIRRLPSSCPVALFLLAKLGLPLREHPTVSQWSVQIRRDYLYLGRNYLNFDVLVDVPLPAWTSKFIQRTDKSGQSTPICKSTALKNLEEVLEA